ncbi:hypothetical protein C2S53_012796 [Perilla frutescens var. hirtella]|uniref:F-box domain-containing protein n=1 Tax=Perilla frutescens var. hirtella TaxID=608512 RepID=A0AAD4JEH4_PERFH|nr:hypothetical protein C2S53_012796 [Perilla frutescens var. hirtella]
MDRLSELPESLILRILSFLEMRDVVRTTLLSKGWKDLWTTIPSLYFDESKKSLVQTRKFINGVLQSWKGTKILSFKITFGKAYDASLSGNVDFWVGFAMERKVEVLFLCLPYDSEKPAMAESDPVHLPPQCLYSCPSIRKLKLIGYSIQIDRENGNVQWDRLKSLTIHGHCVSEDLLNQLVSSATRLEILYAVLCGSCQKLSIRSSSLKKLTLSHHALLPFADGYDPSNYAALTIWAPNLEALSISGATYNPCLLLNVPSLTDVALHFYDYYDVRVGETLKKLLPAIQHVKALTLSLCCFKVLRLMKAKCSFSNVKLLKFVGYPIEPYDLVGLVDFFPNVEKLVFDWKRDEWNRVFIANQSQKHDFGENYSESEANQSSFMMQLRAVEVTWYAYKTTSMFLFIKFLMKHATMLKKMVIKKGGNDAVQSHVMLRTAIELLSLQRSFPTTDLIFCKK